MLIPLLLMAVQAGSPSPGGPDSVFAFLPDSATVAAAYANPETRELVRLARTRRGMLDASVFRYQATVRQRLSVGVRALRRDRLLYRRETASRVDWRRDGPGVVEVLGAREAVPVAVAGLRVPDGLEEFARGLVPKPGDSQLIISVSGDGFAWHPLIPGGEAVYDYAIGDTTEIRLPEGRAIRLVELRVTPRQRDIRLITGSFWIDSDTHAIVQAVFRPSREFDLDRDLAGIDPEEEDADGVPGILKPIRLDVRYIAVEYGLWELRWWMPRLMVLDGYLEVGPAQFPISFEISYSDYTVEADRHGLPELPPAIRQLAGDPTAEPRPFEHPMTVVVADTTELLASRLLPASLYDDDPLISARELRELASRVEALPPVPWDVERPRLTWPWQLGRGLVRYNRVEGLSAGARVDLGLGRAHADLTARVGTADLEPRAELGLAFPTLRRTWRLAGYHRLAAMDPVLRPLELGNSLDALVFGRDQGSYFGATGAELTVTPAPGEASYDLRLYVERQRPVARQAEFSVARLIDGRTTFRPNPAADPLTQLGISASFRIAQGQDPRALRWGIGFQALAETGDVSFVRPGVSLSAGFPLTRSLLAGLEVAGGTTVGATEGGEELGPIQSLWHLGGPATVRGFDGSAAIGREYARGRFELATAFPAARLVLFSDAGWAGDADAFAAARALVSAGAGAGFLDGLVRIDLSRTLQPEHRWRLELYADGLF